MQIIMHYELRRNGRKLPLSIFRHYPENYPKGLNKAARSPWCELNIF
jgi:hypothetical protein